MKSERDQARARLGSLRLFRLAGRRPAARTAGLPRRQNGHFLKGLDRALRPDVERAQQRDLVAVELKPDRRGHSEPVEVHDAAPRAELTDFRDHDLAFEAQPHEPALTALVHLRLEHLHGIPTRGDGWG